MTGTETYDVHFRNNTKEKLRKKEGITIEEVQEVVCALLKTNKVIKLKVIKCQKNSNNSKASG